jgi:hypothetical protein
MELSIVMRLRIAAAMLTGAVILGFIAWPLVAPADPLGSITLFAGQISILDGIILAALAYITGFAAYFAAYPCGRPIAPLAVPTGLAVWTFRSGSVESLIRANRSLAEKQAVYKIFQFESIFWLGLVMIGYLGILTAVKLKTTELPKQVAEAEKDTKKNQGLRIAMSLLATTVIALFCIGILAQDVRRFDAELKYVVGQPGIGQIAFAVIVAFGLTAFLSKRFLNLPPIVPTAASVLIMIISSQIYSNNQLLEHMSENWPISFFPRAISAILPLQIVAFAAIGSITGYWLAIRYAYWRKHEQ